MDRVVFFRKPPKTKSGKILRPTLRAVLRGAAGGHINT
ncbi:MAG: hypothetical protein MGAcid_05200 [uncultured Acidilobus sp. MG]|nr:MAG: hypothetical protein MGAcid_05200 [uncultured Acidilobus sp. MG]